MTRIPYVRREEREHGVADAAYATVWLLSGESSYVNAHPLVLDGGATSFALPSRRLGTCR